MIPSRSARLPWTRAAVPLTAAAALACGALPAHAENWPVYVTASQRVSHDSNLFRTKNNAESDTVSATELTLGLDKSYGRQTYALSVSGNVNRYQNNDQLDYTGMQADGSVTSTFGKDLFVSAGFNRSRALATFDNGNDGLTAKNIRQASSYAINARYGLYGAMSIGAAASHFDQTYSAATGRYPDQTSDSYGFDVRYTPRQLLSFGVGYRHSPGSTSYNLTGTNEFDYDTKTNNLDLTTNWQVTGLSSMSARLSYTRQERSTEGRNRLVDDGYNGWTGSLDWTYTPRGRLSYRLGLSRDTTNNAAVYDLHGMGDQSNFLNIVLGAENGDSRVNTTVNAGVDWDATAKVRVSLQGTLVNLQTTQTNVTTRLDPFSGEPVNFYDSDEKTGRQTMLSLRARYAALRWLSFNCGVSKVRRTADLFNDAYRATVVDCSAAATLNAQN